MKYLMNIGFFMIKTIESFPINSNCKPAHKG